MFELRMIYTRGPNDGDEEIHFTDADEEAETCDWVKPGWEAISDNVICVADGGEFPGSFPSEHSFTRTN